MTITTTTPNRHRRLIAFGATLTLAGALTSAGASPNPAVATDDQRTSEIQAILDASLEPGAINWDVGGVDGSPTGVAVAVRVPGRDDILLASGENVDGTPFDPGAPFATGGLTPTLVATIAFQLIDEGALDPAATIDQWLPDQPNADRITITMLLEGTHGWSDNDAVETANITADLTRRWTLAEVLDAAAATPAAEPETFNADGVNIAYAALAVVIEQVTGSPLADLVSQRITVPAGLDDTFIQDGTDQPDGYQHGVFVFDGQRLDTSQLPNIAYYTYYAAEQSTVSTTSDLLDLLDAWVAGSLFETDRTPAAERFLPSRQNDIGTVWGLGVPFNGYCPCEPAGAGLRVNTVGRRPSGVGTSVQMLHFVDGTSVVLHFNATDVDGAATHALTLDIHDALA